MTEPKIEVTLEDVRARFLEAESRLSEAAGAIEAIEQAAERLGLARESVSAASEQLAGLAAALGEVALGLNANATHLREGVDAIRAGDPAEIKRRIEELDAAFTAMQSVTAERSAALDVTLRERFDDAQRRAQEASVASLTKLARVQLELRVSAAVIGVLVAVSIAMTLVR